MEHVDRVGSRLGALDAAARRGDPPGHAGLQAAARRPTPGFGAARRPTPGCRRRSLLLAGQPAAGLTSTAPPRRAAGMRAASSAAVPDLTGRVDG
ncbi:MAG TPA: hypothetical protein VK659_19350 [Asanoa sp.]|nr:hypothetical protein [Asanoa sp.]